MHSDVCCVVLVFDVREIVFFVCRYSVVKRADNSQLLMVATERIASLGSLLGTELHSVATFTGNDPSQLFHYTAHACDHLLPLI